MPTTTNTRYLILKDMVAEYSTRYVIKTLAAGEVVTRKEFIEFFECHLSTKGNGYYRENYDEYSYALCLKTKTVNYRAVNAAALSSIFTDTSFCPRSTLPGATALAFFLSSKSLDLLLTDTAPLFPAEDKLLV